MTRNLSRKPKTQPKTKAPKVSADLNRTLRDLEKSLQAWDSVKDQSPSGRADARTDAASREAELSLRTHMLFLMLKEQIDELSGAGSR